MKKLLLSMAAVVAVGGVSWWGYDRYWDREYSALEHYAVVKSADVAELAMIDIRVDELAGKIRLPVHPDYMAISASMSRIVYANRENQTLTIMDIQDSDDIVIDLPIVPDALNIAPNGFEASVVNQDDKTIVSISLSDAEILDVIEGVENPLSMSYSDDSEYLFVPNGDTQEVQVVSAIMGSIMDPIELSMENGSNSAAYSLMTRTPNGLYGILVDQNTGRMPMVNFTNWNQVDTLPVGSEPQRPYITADGRFVVVANTGNATTTVISTEHFETVGTLPGVNSLAGISTGFFETLAFLASDSENKAVVLDLESMESYGEVDLGGTPSAPVGDADGRRIYVTIQETGDVVVFDTFSRTITARIKNVISNPEQISMAKTNNYCH